MADNASGSTNVNMRIFPAFALDSPRHRHGGGLPPDYHAAINDQFVPRASETEVDNARSCHGFAFANEPLTNQRLTLQSGQFGRRAYDFHASRLFLDELGRLSRLAIR